jgi:hypothetical protein
MEQYTPVVFFSLFIHFQRSQYMGGEIFVSPFIHTKSVVPVSPDFGGDFHQSFPVSPDFGGDFHQSFPVSPDSGGDFHRSFPVSPDFGGDFHRSFPVVGKFGGGKSQRFRAVAVCWRRPSPLSVYQNKK